MRSRRLPAGSGGEASAMAAARPTKRPPKQRCWAAPRAGARVRPPGRVHVPELSARTPSWPRFVFLSVHHHVVKPMNMDL